MQRSLFNYFMNEEALQAQKLFFDAVWVGNLQEVKRLCRTYRINVNEVKDGYTALSIASIHLQPNLVKFLLKKGADINISLPHPIFTEGTVLFDMVVYRISKVQSLVEYQQAETIIRLLWEHHPNAYLHCYSNSNSQLFFIDLIKYFMKKIRKKLITFDLSNRNVNDNDLDNLSDVLKQYGFHRSISKLNLSNNCFSHSGLAALANSLKTNNTLRFLNLSNNKNIGCRLYFSSGFQSLINALYTNTTLEYLDVSNCPLDHADINTLLQFLRNRPHNSKLLSISFDVSEDVITNLSLSDRNYINTIRKQASFFNIINQCQEKILRYQPVKKREKTLVTKSIEFLNICKGIYSGEDEIDSYLEGVMAGLMQFINVALEHDYVELTHLFDETLKIINLSRATVLLKIINEYDKVNVKPQDVFRCVFENNMHALCSASWNIYSGYIKSQVITPTEKILKSAKNIILSLSGVAKIVEQSGQVLGLAGEHLKATIIEGAECISKTAEISHVITDVHYNIDNIKNSIIRKIHGLTIEDNCKNLVYCFKNLKTALSKITAISQAIIHYYDVNINKLSTQEAAIVAKYAFLHIAGLLMSGHISKQLTADLLIEEIVPYLSYVSIRDTVIRTDLLTNNEKQFAEKFFMQPGLKFYSNTNENKLFNCTVNSQEASCEQRWATQAEIKLLNTILSMQTLDEEFAGTGSTDTLVKYPLSFYTPELSAVKHMTFETKSSSYKSKRKELDELKRQFTLLTRREFVKNEEELAPSEMITPTNGC